VDRLMTGLKVVASSAALIVGAMVLAGLTVGPASAQLPGEGAAVVCLYQNANYRGQRFCVDDEAVMPRLLRSRADQISSFRVSPGWGLKVCRDRDFGGWCRYFSGSVKRLRLSNDRISSIEVFRLLTADPRPAPAPPPVTTGVVCLFSDPDFRGEAICVDDEIEVRRLQPWDDNSVSSFKVTDGYKLRACRDPNFGGWCREFTGDEARLRASNDAISSFEVSRIVVEPPRLRIACLFTEPDFGGLAVCADQPEQIANLGPRLDNQISSVRLAVGWAMVVCNQPAQQGRCLRIDGDRAQLGPRFDNRVSSYRVFEAAASPPPPPPQDGIISSGPDGGSINLPGLIGAIAGEVCFFEHADYRGGRVCHRAGTEIRSVGPARNNSFSAVRVPNGLVAVGCELPNFGGLCQRFDRDVRFMAGFNDRISSYRIMPNFGSR
jgi:hypothetical protein